jgi:hypothetical protein
MASRAVVLIRADVLGRIRLAVAQHGQIHAHGRMQGHLFEQLAIIAECIARQHVVVRGQCVRLVAEPAVGIGHHEDLRQGKRNALTQLVDMYIARRWHGERIYAANGHAPPGFHAAALTQVIHIPVLAVAVVAIVIDDRLHSLKIGNFKGDRRDGRIHLPVEPALEAFLRQRGYLGETWPKRGLGKKARCIFKRNRLAEVRRGIPMDAAIRIALCMRVRSQWQQQERKQADCELHGWNPPNASQAFSQGRNALLALAGNPCRRQGAALVRPRGRTHRFPGLNRMTAAKGGATGRAVEP